MLCRLDRAEWVAGVWMTCVITAKTLAVFSWHTSSRVYSFECSSGDIQDLSTILALFSIQSGPSISKFSEPKYSVCKFEN